MNHAALSLPISIMLFVTGESSGFVGWSWPTDTMKDDRSSRNTKYLIFGGGGGIYLISFPCIYYCKLQMEKSPRLWLPDTFRISFVLSFPCFSLISVKLSPLNVLPMARVSLEVLPGTHADQRKTSHITSPGLVSIERSNCSSVCFVGTKHIFMHVKRTWYHLKAAFPFDVSTNALCAQRVKMFTE